VVLDGRDAYAGQLRGWGLYARRLADTLAAAPPGGIDVQVVSSGGRGPETLFEQVGLPRLLRRRNADAVHTTNCFLPLQRPCPGVVTVHDLAFEAHPEDFSRRTGLKYRTLAPLAARSAERVICVSEHMRDDVCERYGVEPERTRVVLSAPSLPLSDAVPPDGPYLLAVGDLRAKKNLPRLVRAFRALRAEGLPHRLVLAGLDLGAGEALRAEAGDAPVELAGYVSDVSLDALMRGDLLVYPSLYEGFGLAIVEAMVRGTPVAAADASSLPEAGGNAAAYFDPLDVEDMATTIARVLGDPQERAAMSERGCDHVAGLSWERTARETAAVYRELLSDR